MTNIQIVKEHFKAYKKLDSKKMCSYISEEIEFKDPSININNTLRFKYFIQFLIENMGDHTILDMEEIEESGDVVTLKWKSSYLLKLNNKRIELNYTTHYTLKEKLIVKQVNEYNLTEYLNQAFGKFLTLSYKFDRIKKMMAIQTDKILGGYIANNELMN